MVNQFQPILLFTKFRTIVVENEGITGYRIGKTVANEHVNSLLHFGTKNSK